MRNTVNATTQSNNIESRRLNKHNEEDQNAWVVEENYGSSQKREKKLVKNQVLLVCQFCNKTGHRVRKCWDNPEAQTRNRPPKWKMQGFSEKQNFKKTSSSFRDMEVTKLLRAENYKSIPVQQNIIRNQREEIEKLKLQLAITNFKVYNNLR